MTEIYNGAMETPNNVANFKCSMCNADQKMKSRDRKYRYKK